VNVTYTLTSDFCVPTACTTNSSDITQLEKDTATFLTTSYGGTQFLNWNSTSTNVTVKCGGFPLWAIILIIIIIIIVVVLIIVGVVVMMRRRNQYQNL